ncbi:MULTISPECIES: sensor histidine kinase [unclassified Corynebacterium]|uniref:sensor histidine kinase n=1 Tax=unclassified Corynebacterium TaxID=2624378 RepID=UPI00265406F4|nr:MULTISPECIES: histidine kinase [unclassified Corynebacterium]MDN8594069.1 histidine kinase [Corynebacterium sp. P4_F2]WKK56738.1 histidine kinase [Corynebacterium sp. P4-C1]
MRSGEVVVSLLGAVLATAYTAMLFTGRVGATDWIQAALSWAFVGALAQWQRRPALVSALMVGLNIAWSVLWVIAPTNIGYTLWVVLVPLAVYLARRKVGGRFAWTIAGAAAAWSVASPFMWTWDDRLVLFYRRPVDAALMLALHWAVLAVAYLMAANGAAEEAAKANEARRREEKIAAAREEERLDTAREIHDVLGHSLTLIKVQANAGLAAGTERESLELIRNVAAESLRDIRLLVKGLRDEGPGLAPAGGADSIPAVVDRFRSTGMEVALDMPDSLKMPAITEQAANRIIGESLNNAVKHQDKPAARVTIAQEKGNIVVKIASTGRPSPNPGAGTGIVGMQERARATGGHLDFTQDSNTVTVTATLGV